MELIQIAHIENGYKAKFGIPRQSGLATAVESRIVMEKGYAMEEAFRGIEDYDYLWLIWGFSKNVEKPFSATVKPPRLGGKIRMGVFATRSPYRPNPLGLSSVKLERVEHDDKHGTVLVVSGADLLDGTPIYDIKPYLAYADAHAGARSGFTDDHEFKKLEVVFPTELLNQVPTSQRAAVLEILEQDPRPGYDKGIDREFKIAYGSVDITFVIEDERARVIAVRNL